MYSTCQYYTSYKMILAWGIKGNSVCKCTRDSKYYMDDYEILHSKYDQTSTLYPDCKVADHLQNNSVNHAGR